jgi:hypothetical protein
LEIEGESGEHQHGRVRRRRTTITRAGLTALGGPRGWRELAAGEARGALEAVGWRR